MCAWYCRVVSVFPAYAQNHFALCLIRGDGLASGTLNGTDFMILADQGPTVFNDPDVEKVLLAKQIKAQRQVSFLKRTLSFKELSPRSNRGCRHQEWSR